MFLTVIACVILAWLVHGHIRLQRTVRTLRADVDRLAHRQGPSAGEDGATDAAVRNPPERPVAPDETVGEATTPIPPGLPVASEAADTPPRSYVFDPATFERLAGWVRENWLVAVGAVSLAMAGVFLVQWGMERGLLSPPLRVLAALGFGLALIGTGEWVRRRGGDAPGDLAAFVPSAFAGAGIVTLFSGILAARQLYDLIGARTAFVALAGIAALAVLLGWVYGPFLTVVGIVGAVAAPFVVGGEAESVHWLFYYFVLIAAVGLGVDAMKRSAWISAVAVAVPCLGALAIWLGSESVHALGFAALLAVATVCIPNLALRPAFDGAMIFHGLRSRGEPGWPEFPTRLAGTGLIVLAVTAIFVSLRGEAAFWLSLGALGLALGALAFWLDRTAVLDDLAIPVALAMLAIVGLHGILDRPVARLTVDDMQSSGVVRTLVGAGLAITALTGWKSLRTARFAVPWAAGSALFAPAVMLLLWLYWDPVARYGERGWAVHVLVVAAAMTVLAERTRRVEGPGGVRTALFALAGLNMIALAMAVLMTQTALTLGFAVVVVSAAWLDRRFDLPLVGWFVQIGVAACSYRLVIDPGLPWALDAGLAELAAGFAGTLALLALAWWLLQFRERAMALAVVESAIFGLLGLFACILAFRGLEAAGSDSGHAYLGLFALVWLVNAAVQTYRAGFDGPLRRLRMGLAAVFGTLGLLFLGLAATIFNPLGMGGEVAGPPIFDSLALVYLLPALLLAGMAHRFAYLPDWVRVGLGVVATAAATLWAGLEIRRLWQGPDLSVAGVRDGELYSYTLAMLLCGSVLLLLAYLRRSAVLRKAGMAVVALTVAKVFLVDMAGLQGLLRVLSFLALGVVLAGLALLNRWITGRLDAP